MSYMYVQNLNRWRAKMFGFDTLAVIKRYGVVGIICGWDGHFAKIMFEVGSNEFEFANYPVSAVARFQVVG